MSTQRKTKTEMPTEDIELLAMVSGISFELVQTIVHLAEEHLREKLRAGG